MLLREITTAGLVGFLLGLSTGLLILWYYTRTKPNEILFTAKDYKVFRKLIANSLWKIMGDYQEKHLWYIEAQLKSITDRNLQSLSKKYIAEKIIDRENYYKNYKVDINYPPRYSKSSFNNSGIKQEDK